MPNGKTHKAISTVGGLGLGLQMSAGMPGDVLVVRTAATTIGAVMGGALPDILEPGIHSWHRKAAHSAAVGGGLTWLGLSSASGFQDLKHEWESKAFQLREARLALPQGYPDRSTLWLQEMGLHALVGLLTGLLFGYVLHLAADATTPRSLPLV